MFTLLIFCWLGLWYVVCVVLVEGLLFVVVSLVALCVISFGVLFLCDCCCFNGRLLPVVFCLLFCLLFSCDFVYQFGVALFGVCFCLIRWFW